MTARWSNPIVLTFEAPPDVVRPHLHPDLEPDEWEGRTHVSLVVFDFQDTRIRGRRIPGYVNFTQLNLRTYVRQGSRRGVTYLREFVPSRVIALLARLRFNEPYHRLDIHSETSGAGDALTIEHHWTSHGHQEFIRTTATQASTIPRGEAAIDRFTRHRWGFGVNRSGALVPYRVEHPDWAFRTIQTLDYHLDFGRLFGNEWAFLGDRNPAFQALAVGSAVELFPPGR